MKHELVYVVALILCDLKTCSHTQREIWGFYISISFCAVSFAEEQLVSHCTLTFAFELCVRKEKMILYEQK